MRILILATCLTAVFTLTGCGGDAGTDGGKDAKAQSPNAVSPSDDTASPTKLNPSELTRVRPTDPVPKKQSEVARLIELADTAEAQGEYAHAAAYLQAAMPLAISLEPPLRGTLEIAEPGHTGSAIKQDMLSESAIMLVARQIMRQNNPFDASEQVAPEHLAHAIAAGLIVSPKTTHGVPPFTVIIECDAKQLEWDPTRNWQLAREAVDRSVQNFIRRQLDKREKMLLEQRIQLEADVKKLGILKLAAVEQAEHFAKRHPGVAIDNVGDAQKELDDYYTIAKDAYERNVRSRSAAMDRHKKLGEVIADSPDVEQSKSLSKEARDLKTLLASLEVQLEYHLIELRRPKTHEKVIAVQNQIKAANARLNGMSEAEKFDVKTVPNEKKLKLKVDRAELAEQIETLKTQGQTMRDVLIRYDTVRKDFQQYREKYQAMQADIADQQRKEDEAHARLREVNDQLRSPTASAIRYIAAPPQFPSWTKWRNRLNALQQQAGQFGQLEGSN